MHSGFGAIRSNLGHNIRRRADARAWSADVVRVIALWTTLHARFGGNGPYLFGAAPTIADAFFVPMASRFRTYGIPLEGSAGAYADALLQEPSFLAWERDALAEQWTIEGADHL
jgi:glutathione S-transferase